MRLRANGWRSGVAVLMVGVTGLSWTAVSNEPTHLIPREAFEAGQDSGGTDPVVSPDGKLIAFNRIEAGVLNAWVAPVNDLAAARQVTHEEGRGVTPSPPLWAPDSQHLLLYLDRGGDSVFAIYSFDIRSARKIALTPHIAGWPPRLVNCGLSSETRRGKTILIAFSAPRRSIQDVYAVNVETGARLLVQRGRPGFLDFWADEHWQPVLAEGTTKDGAHSLYRRRGRDWQRVLSWPYEDESATDVIGIEPGGQSALLTTSLGRDKPALERLNFKNSALSVVAESQKESIAVFAPALIDPEGRLQAYAAGYLLWHNVGLTPDVAQDFHRIEAQLGPNFRVTSRSRDGKVWTLQSDEPRLGISTYLFERPFGRLSKLFDAWPKLAGERLQPMYPLEIKARDGLTLTAYLTLPMGVDEDGHGRPSHPVPLVLIVHGGPNTAFERYGFRADQQLYANRGYAVLAVNFRMSGGLGKAFARAGEGEVGRKMQTDLIDAVDWAIAHGIAEPSKVAIEGASYGGYAVLAGLTFTPTKFACGVDRYGVSDAVASFSDPEAARLPSERALLQRNYGADPSTKGGRERLNEVSPIRFADRIVRPLLIMQGDNDPAVARSQSDRMVAAMRAAGKPVTYIVFGDEGHGFTRPANNAAADALVEHFLSRCLGGAEQPFGPVFTHSTMRVEADAGYISGLPRVTGDSGRPGN